MGLEIQEGIVLENSTARSAEDIDQGLSKRVSIRLDERSSSVDRHVQSDKYHQDSEENAYVVHRSQMK